jgi:hypothetical protein
LVVGLVRVEGVDDIIPVAPGIGPELIALKAVGIGVMGDVEPVARPSFSVVGRCEEFIHQEFPSVGPGILEELCDALWGRREAVQIKAEPSDEGAPIRFGGRDEVVLLELRGDEGVDGKLLGRQAERSGQSGDGLQRLHGPVPPSGIDGRGAVGIVFRPDGTALDPGGHRSDLCRCQAGAVRWHALIVVPA